ncbi:hypothetical protein BY996DRAFT_6578712 [Phakopsora pachyrhizi]|nr:hypothetical protein BY996DRAFT_6578712 [Phakopsora pachyrhizi]
MRLTTTITSEMIDMFQLEVSIRSLRGASMADDSCRLAQALEPMALKVRSEDSVSVEDHQSEMRRERVKGTPLCVTNDYHLESLEVLNTVQLDEDSTDEQADQPDCLTDLEGKELQDKRLVRMLNGNKRKQKKDHDGERKWDISLRKVLNFKRGESQLQRRIQRYSSEGTSNHSGLLVEEKEERERNTTAEMTGSIIVPTGGATR